MPGAIRLTARNGTVTGDGQIAPERHRHGEQAVHAAQRSDRPDVHAHRIGRSTARRRRSRPPRRTPRQARSWPTSRSSSSAGWTKPIRMAISADEARAATNPARQQPPPLAGGGLRPDVGQRSRVARHEHEDQRRAIAGATKTRGVRSRRLVRRGSHGRMFARAARICWPNSRARSVYFLRSSTVIRRMTTAATTRRAMISTPPLPQEVCQKIADKPEMFAPAAPKPDFRNRRRRRDL